jgi:hypothetical protein
MQNSKVGEGDVFQGKTPSLPYLHKNFGTVHQQ